MSNNISYVYGTDNCNNKVLLGAKVCGKDFEQNIYIGFHLIKEDILYNKINANALGIRNLDMFSKSYDEASASGIVFFPQTDNYLFLKDDDVVVHWKSNDTIQEELEIALESYRFLESEDLENNIIEMTENFNFEDSLILLKKQCSNR